MSTAQGGESQASEPPCWGPETEPPELQWGRRGQGDDPGAEGASACAVGGAARFLSCVRTPRF